MFSQFFGNYLLEHNVITKQQFTECMDYMKVNCVKLGLIAESEGLLTRAQANELNRLQMNTDRRFGELAIEKGYLTENDISKLLHLQGSPYLIFIQALQENQLLTRDEIDSLLNDYQQETHMSNSDLAALRAGNLDEMVNFFVPAEDQNVISLFTLALRNITRFVSPYIRFEGPVKTSTYTGKSVALQRTNGERNGFLAFASEGKEILKIADGFAGEFFDQVDEDSLDSVCEFINCINGLYASELSFRNTTIDMLPPEFGFDHTISSNQKFYVLPIYIKGKHIDLIVGVDCTLQ